MCLDRVSKVGTLRQRGYAYKVVRPSPYVEGDYFGKWPSFNIGGGGTGNNLRGVTVKGTLRNGVTWKIGRLYRVKHNRVTYCFDNRSDRYPAWVHLYKTPNETLKHLRYGEVVLVCYYTSGKYEDGKTIVAKRVTPLLMLQNEQQVYDFFNLRKHFGFKLAIKKFQE